MPSRNVLKIYAGDSYYHIYNRGVEKRQIFLDNQDYSVFLNLLKRYLSNKPVLDKKGRQYPWLNKDLKLLAFCLMPNHFHLFIHQKESETMQMLLSGICTSYTVYFNKKYKRVGPLFQSRYKASMILSDEYYQHISRYIHLNPKDYLKWEWSSLPYYLGMKQASWVETSEIMSNFENDIEKYLEFLKDYRGYKDSLDDISSSLAG